ncbi:acyltransferase family protein, partial [Rosenbergiella epipactidis]|uniref:acyltransferase family protein n=1 Tax=Rosenbergiella epipactidis TaxID=1544694 RepID=UPI001F4D7A1B
MGSIQILRGIAVLFVVILHVTHKLQIFSNSNHYFSVGAIGVDLFFVISGFIMMYATEKKDNILEFLLDRFFRIYPIFCFFALVTLSIYFFRPDLVNSHSGKELSFLSTFTLIPLQNKMNIILVSWALSYEIYYYIIFSIAMLLNKYLSINKIISSSLIIFISIFVGFVLNNEFLKNTVILEFIFGMLAYGVFKKDNIKKNIPLDIVCLFIISFGFPIFINFYLNGQEIEFSSYRFLVYGIPMLFLFITFIKYQYVGFFSKTLSLIGNASYS